MGIRVNKLGFSMSMVVVSRQALYTSRSHDTLEEGGWSPSSQKWKSIGSCYDTFSSIMLI